MVSYVVDIGAKILASNHEVYVARPGKGYRLYGEMMVSNSVFPELPLLDLTPGVALADQPDLSRRIRRSAAIRTWHNSGRPDDERPSRSLGDYNSDGGSLRVAQLLGVLRGYFERAQKGDLVIVPPSGYTQDCLIGEFTSEPTEFVRHGVDRYGSDYLTARPVKWLARVQKRQLSSNVLEAIEKPTVFFLLDRPSRNFIYERAYGSFSLGSEFNAKFDVSSHHFTTADDFLIQAFFNFVTANTIAVQEGRNGDVKGFSEAIFVDLAQHAPDLRTNVNSPGFLNLSSSSIAPIVASVLLAIAISVGPDAVRAAEEGRITLGNTGGPNGDSCTASVQHQVITQLRLLGLDKWPEACERAKQAESRTGLRGRATVRRDGSSQE